MCRFVWLLAGGLLMGASALAQERDAQKDANQARLKKLEYPKGIVENESDLGIIAQREWVTPDDLEAVETWYRKQLGLNKAFLGGIANIPWPSGAKVTEAKGQQQWVIVRDDLRLKNDGTRYRDVRAGTARTFLLRTPEETILVVLNRGPQDKQTLISVTILNTTKR